VIGFAWSHVSDDVLLNDSVRNNRINELSEILDLFEEEKNNIVSLIDCSYRGSAHRAIFIRKKG